jgi:ComF family protein
MSAEYACSACHTPFVSAHPLDQRGLCSLCRLGLAGYDGAFSFGFYEGTLRRLIHLFKFEGVPSLSAALGRYMVRALPLDRQFDAVVPMPLHWFRRWRRGFNQSELLAGEVARRLGLPLLSGVLGRKRHAAPQSGLSSAARRRNVAGLFSVADRRPVKGLRVLLVDDVLTTGATAQAAARALKKAGASQVIVLTVARADRRDSVAIADHHAVGSR